MRGFPALVDEGATVGLQVLATAVEAAAHHRLGVRRLVLLALGPPAPVDDVLADAGLDQRAKLALVGSPYSSVGELLDDVRAGIVGEVVDQHPTVRDEAAYDAVVAACREAVTAGLGPAVHDVMRVLEAWRTADRAISGRADLMTLPALTDMRAQVGRLMAAGFVGEAGVGRLRDYPRYLAAVTHRRERLDSQVARDRQLMDQLADLGIALSLDDFGTGYSSLLHLRRLPLTEVKIDRSFVQRMAVDPDDEAIVRSIIDLSQALGLRVVAEGVEDDQTNRLLAEAGCEIGQGWAFARPMPAGELPNWIARHNDSVSQL